MTESVLLDLLHQPSYLDELEYFALADIDELANYELEKLGQSLNDAISELTLAIQLDAACGIEFDETFIDKVLAMIGKLTCQMGRTVHKLVASS